MTASALVDVLYEVRDRIVVAINRLQNDDAEAAAAEIETAAEGLRSVVDGETEAAA